MPPTSSVLSIALEPVPARSLQARIEKLEQDLGGRIQRGNHPLGQIDHGRHPSGIEDIDQLLDGGFPAGCLSEICGATSSGRTSLVLGLLRQATRSGAHVAVVDCADAFDPPSAEALGVVLERVLWVRAPDLHTGLRCGERLLATEGFPLVVLDFTASFSKSTSSSKGTPATKSSNTIRQSAWLRLTRLAAKSRNTLILLSHERLAGHHAAVSIQMQPAIPRFSESPCLLEELETHAVLLRYRAQQGGSAAQGRMAKVKLRVASNAA